MATETTAQLQAAFDAALAALVPKQASFVREVLKDSNHKQAAIRAGYAAACAERTGWRLSRSANVSAAIVAGQRVAAAEYEIDNQRLLRDLELEAYASPSLFFKVGKDGLPRVDLRGIPEEVLGLISEITVDTLPGPRGAAKVQRVRIKVVDRQRAKDMLMKHRGLYAPAKIAQTDAEGHDVEPGGRGLSELVAMLDRTSRPTEPAGPGAGSGDTAPAA